MSDRVDPTAIEDIVGVPRHRVRHYARLMLHEERVYILHSQTCLDRHNDLRDCTLSRLLDRTINFDDWPRDRACVIAQRGGRLRPVSPDAAVVEAMLRGRRYRYANELALHDALAGALDAARTIYAREVPVHGGRIDFTVGTLYGSGAVGVEVKVKGTTAAVAAQLARYAEDPRLSELLLVTTRPAHRAVAPTGEIGGTPVRVLCIGAYS